MQPDRISPFEKGGPGLALEEVLGGGWDKKNGTASGLTALRTSLILMRTVTIQKNHGAKFSRREYCKKEPFSQFRSYEKSDF